MKTKVVEILGQEQCVYGGLLATRAQVYDHLRAARGPDGEAIGWLMLDRLTWMPSRATPAQAAELRRRGMTLENLLKNEGPTPR